MTFHSAKPTMLNSNDEKERERKKNRAHQVSRDEKTNRRRKTTRGNSRSGWNSSWKGLRTSRKKGSRGERSLTIQPAPSVEPTGNRSPARLRFFQGPGRTKSFCSPTAVPAGVHCSTSKSSTYLRRTVGTTFAFTGR